VTGPDEVSVSLTHPELSVAVYRAELELAAANFKQALLVGVGVGVGVGDAPVPLTDVELLSIARAGVPFGDAWARLQTAEQLARAGLDDEGDSSSQGGNQ